VDTARRAGTVDTVSDPQLFDVPDAAPDPVVAQCPVGTEIDTQTGRWGLATATFDPLRRYRFRLSRVWGPGTRINFLMLNPSTADAFRLDPTVRRCVGFAQSWGAGSVEVTNLFALRSTQPAGLRAVDDPVGPGNDDAIVAAAVAADVVVAAWGVHGTYRDRAQAVAAALASEGITLRCLRVTRGGHPGHPLYVPADTSPVSWPAS
jgi:hypothetical protein